jgi:hypothetical protein
MKAVFWLLVALGVIYAFYTGTVAVYQYFQVKDVVEESVEAGLKLDRFERSGRVKDEILRRVPAVGVALDARSVLVTEEHRTLRVLIRWSHPVVVYKDEALVSIPISYDKAFTLQSER